jgi:hypothetical protein
MLLQLLLLLQLQLLLLLQTHHVKSVELNIVIEGFDNMLQRLLGHSADYYVCT